MKHRPETRSWPLIDKAILTKSRLYENEISKADLCTCNSSKIIKTSCLSRVSSAYIINFPWKGKKKKKPGKERETEFFSILLLLSFRQFCSSKLNLCALVFCGLSRRHYKCGHCNHFGLMAGFFLMKSRLQDNTETPTNKIWDLIFYHELVMAFYCLFVWFQF